MKKYLMILAAIVCFGINADAQIKYKNNTTGKTGTIGSSGSRSSSGSGGVRIQNSGSLSGSSYSQPSNSSSSSYGSSYSQPSNSSSSSYGSSYSQPSISIPEGQYCASDNSTVFVDEEDISLFIDGYSVGKFLIREIREDGTFTFNLDSGNGSSGEGKCFRQDGVIYLKLGSRILKKCY
jgi:hypothetical protein